ncbi:MAG TPA: cyclic nucleotide-binding domain-containing protein, partial [Ilumatobacteraceae bacterium]|nr:cyclic nucleotide-binding domain-containing protein [Ilumatobacteraceae bacterium]
VPAADHPSHSIASLLGTIPTLRFVSPAGLRVLAEATTRQSLEIGQSVTRQGEHSDAVFLIIDGTFEVLISQLGQTPDFIRMLKAGESFGELGVLYDVPRTATIRCASPGHLLRIPGDPFLDSLDTAS